MNESRARVVASREVIRPDPPLGTDEVPPTNRVKTRRGPTRSKRDPTRDLRSNCVEEGVCVLTSLMFDATLG